MKTILFQGDSITDVGRSREDDHCLGGGYPLLVAQSLGAEGFRFLNRGISGNRSIDLLARVKCDIINLKPDYMSILIGVNDVWHEIDFQNGVDARRFALYCDLLLQEVREALPDLKILLLEPFVLVGPATHGRWEEFRWEVDARAAAVRQLAEKYSLTFVPLQERFDHALESAPATHWLRDGVHPTDAGHDLIRQAWLDAFRQLK